MVRLYCINEQFRLPIGLYTRLDVPGNLGSWETSWFRQSSRDKKTHIGHPPRFSTQIPRLYTHCLIWDAYSLSRRSFANLAPMDIVLPPARRYRREGRVTCVYEHAWRRGITCCDSHSRSKLAGMEMFGFTIKSNSQTRCCWVRRPRPFEPTQSYRDYKNDTRLLRGFLPLFEGK